MVLFSFFNILAVGEFLRVLCGSIREFDRSLRTNGFLLIDIKDRCQLRIDLIKILLQSIDILIEWSVLKLQ